MSAENKNNLSPVNMADDHKRKYTLDMSDDQEVQHMTFYQIKRQMLKALRGMRFLHHQKELEKPNKAHLCWHLILNSKISGKTSVTLALSIVLITRWKVSGKGTAPSS